MLTSWKHRYSVLGILFCAYWLCYMDRMVMASAIPFIAQDFHLSPLSMGGVLSAFFCGYALMQIPGGMLADRFGPRVVLMTSIVWWSAMTFLTGMAPGLVSLVILRMLFGLGEGPFPAAASKALAVWFPARELGRANGIQIGATAIGASVAPLVVVAFIAQWGWRSVFYMLCVPGLVLGVFVWRYIHDAPADSRRVSPQELSEYEPVMPGGPRSTLLDALKTRTVLWCAVCLFFSNIMGWGLMNWLPTYLLDARGFSVAKMGYFTALANGAGALGSFLGGYICDRFFRHALRVPIVAGLVLSAVFTYFAATAPTGEWAVAYLVVVFLISSACNIAIFTLPLIVAPKDGVGSAFGVVNTAGQLAGVLSPLLVGYVLEITHSDFRVVLYSLIGLSVLAIYPATKIRQAPALPDQSFAI